MEMEIIVRTFIKKYLLLAVVWAVPLLCSGQAISNVRFEQKGEKVIISYYLDLNRAGMMKNVKTYMSLDGGKTYKPLAMVSGDVGTVTQSGERQIIFDIFSEFGNEEISGDIKFKVEGEAYTSPFKPVAAILPIGISYSFAETFGLSIGYCNKWGGYFNFKTRGLSDGYLIDVDISDVDFKGRIYYRQAYSAGVMRHLVNFSKNNANGLYLYGGLGYGEYGAAYLVSSTVYYRPELQKGMEAEAGIIAVFGVWTLSCGYNTLFTFSSQRQFADVHIGIGINILEWAKN
jgi:hypothetical protein